MSGIQQLLLGGSPAGGYQIERSLRFNSADSAYLNRTPASTTNRRTWTVSCWIKRSRFSTGTEQTIFGSNNGSTFTELNYNASSDVLRLNLAAGAASYFFDTTAVFRDPSAWYHIVVAVDTTQATAADRMKVYINGVQQAGTNNAPVQNYDTQWNVAQNAFIGSRTASTWFNNCYLTEFYNIDGQALTPSSFGQTNSSTGVWEPIKYTGTYGTNGFYLNFSDNSNTTAATLGKDSSGNGNNWTPNNFSVTAGSGNDSLVDTPTSYGSDTGAGGEVRGNYCTLSPLPNGPGGTLSNGNLYATSGVNSVIYSTFALTSEKFYWEVTLNGSTTQQIGLADITKTNTTNSAPGDSGRNGYIYLTTGYIYNNGTALSSGLSTSTTNDVICCAYDSANNKLWIRKNNGTWFGGGDPTTGSTPTATTSTSYTYTPVLGAGGGSDAVNAFCNFGQRPFSYTAPSGFKALCTQNLPTPTIGATSTTQAGKYMNAVLYTGNGATGQTITGVGFEPDFVWVKSRSNTQIHGQYDRLRYSGSSYYYLASDTTNAELTGNFSALTSDGWTFNGATHNTSTYTYVGWAWKANGAGSSNTAGSITSTVSANTTAGFSIVTYTGNGTVGATVGHGLGATPGMVIVKSRSTAQNWPVKILPYMTGGQRLQLNTTDAIFTENAGAGSLWNATNPNSTVITLGDQAMTNTNGTTYVAYCFAPVAGYSAFGSYTGNGSSDGPFVFTGFRPRWILLKRTDSAADWFIGDTSRNTANSVNNLLQPSTSNAESTYGATAGEWFDLLSNGFKLRSTITSLNASGGTYIYAAFAENPFKYSLAR